MDKFLSGLGGGGGKKNKAKKVDNKNKHQGGKDGANSDWQGGRSGDMESIKRASASSRLIRDGGGNNKTAGSASGDTKNSNIFAHAGAGINDALGKMDLFKKQNGKSNSSIGGGQSLGGAKPGRVFSVSLDKPGSLGMEVEKRKNTQATTIIASVVPNGQAYNAGLKRGDIVCYPRSNGEREVRYDLFLSEAKSGRRPLRFDVRRIESSISNGAESFGAGGRVSADSYARKQAVIAAAEAREAKHRAKQKPIPKSEKRMDGLQPKDQQQYQHDQTVDSVETRRAVAAAKQAEQDDAKNLGYNPYEAKAMTSGQARTATVTMARGEINAENAPSKLTSSGEGDSPSPGRVNKPEDPTSKTDDPPTPEFQHAFSAVVTTNADNVAVLKSLRIMRTLIKNATTAEASSKFRRVRLSNPKIKQSITDTHGALELMMSVGFVLSENDEDGETYLAFPPGETRKIWLDNALQLMDSYEHGGVSL